ncbi:ribonucleoside-diphosphate reductase subunit alpha [Exiguobacterium sp. SH1S4]|nr:ribonucleoside-diphosphate reductase subunit alpha [Exiguobacterium sp. SH4S7]TCI47884.1 ribonucleoside-diphosphate reductase subunit alpha [Exiguobacterium sp. SH5S32]TCI54768.1 ribonucleoside-diphosphate reductase subunit alpha [Exiguobacterium sp. SH1S4]TCI74564.1 ribonucleoside-diphosphate reductase subunit alpha [Exiguobacterium sp. SH1S1]
MIVLTSPIHHETMLPATPTLADVATLIQSLTQRYPQLSVARYEERLIRALDSKSLTQDVVYDLMTMHALDMLKAEEPDWTFVATEMYLNRLYLEAARNRGYDASMRYGSLYSMIETLTNKGIFTSALIDTYSKEDIAYLETLIDPSRDRLFTYIGLRTLSDRYLGRDHVKNLYELPQERFMVIAMTLMQNEAASKRVQLAEEAYWALSNLYMTVATPTLSNAGKSYGQLSSCFIDTVDDSLRGIYDSNTDVATLSKGGGGIGVYLGKIRSRGSDIKGFKGVSSGALPWMKQLNNTAVSVDQLGMRQGSIAVYLDIWHKDIFEFLDAKLNNGDERLRTHDLFTGVCLPDLFMRTVEARGDWHLFDPHEIRTVMGFSLEDFYDETDNGGSFTEKYTACVNNPELTRVTVPAIDLVKRYMRSQLETGTPYMFFRDAVNRANPNKHAGMIYSSNLCSEIAQNMSATTIDEEYTADGKIVITKTPGDFVVCNLSSIALARAVKSDVLERLIPIQMRMLDNVIDLNTIEVPQAMITNQKYRSVGLGTFGWHHLLALEGIRWESVDAVHYAEKLYEKIAYLTIHASMELAKEKGAFGVFEGSEWHTGEYFSRRNYRSHDELDWDGLAAEVHQNGVRNAYMMAVAPNSSTAIIAGSTASIDPIYKKVYSEEKKNYKIPVTVPDLNSETNWFYKSAFEVDQLWSIRQNAARQRHIDQAISFNLYVKNDVKATEMLGMHLEAWSLGMKSIYYTRSTTVEVDECESCSS